MTDEPPVVELEFVFNAPEFPLGQVATAAGCDLDVELIVPRTDGSVLAFVTFSRSSLAKILDAVQANPSVHEARWVEEESNGVILEAVLDGRPVTTLADANAVVTRLSVTDGRARIVADVPSHIDAGRVIEAFMADHESAQLVARRRTDRQSPLLGQSQFVTRVLGQFTERQLHVLRVAYDHGYFEWPRRCRAEDVADELDIAIPTFSQHVRAAEQKLMRVLFEG